MQTYFSCYKTRFGYTAFVWSYFGPSPKILRVYLASSRKDAQDWAAKDFAKIKVKNNPIIFTFFREFLRFLNGKDVDFRLKDISLDACTEFQKKVLMCQRLIPRGRVCTYKMLARRIRRPRSYRAVGAALAANPFPIIIPCHRTICSDGYIGEYQGGVSMKKALLQYEGLRFNDNKMLVC